MGMTAEERALLHLRIGDLKRSLRKPQQLVGWADLVYMTLGCLACAMLGQTMQNSMLPLMIFLAVVGLCNTATHQAEKRINGRIDKLLEIDEIRQQLGQRSAEGRDA
jgi:hypothetical protein